MSTIFKASGVISNPVLGKILAMRMITSCSLVRSATTDLLSTQTDTFAGGTSYGWSGGSMFNLTDQGLTNIETVGAGTTYLNMPETKDFRVDFEINGSGSEIIFDLRRKKTDNYCYRFHFSSLIVKVARRNEDYTTGMTIVSNTSFADGSLISISLTGDDITVKANGETIVTYTDATPGSLADRSGVLAISKGSASTSHEYIKNLKVYSLD
ncbi:TPA: hypothetical protein N3K55_000613 [Klebsiella pneumoniae]|nr:hypothetical protein [Klebsiella pneumoniae]